MRIIDPNLVSTSEVHRYLLACVAPRPIALVGTSSGTKVPNLAPFSFFNAFGANPPVVAFSPAFRGVDGTSKHTFNNIKETREFTISVVSHTMVHRMSYASADWPEDVSEFEAVGLTPAPSEQIAPPGVAESPMFMECRLIDHLALGNGPGSGQLMVGEVVRFHIKDGLFDGPYPDYRRLDLVARMGGPHYLRANGEAVFTLPKPGPHGATISELPDDVKESPILTGEDLARLAAAMHIAIEKPSGVSGQIIPGLDDLASELANGVPDRIVSAFMRDVSSGVDLTGIDTHRVARRLIVIGAVVDAWTVLRELH